MPASNFNFLEISKLSRREQFNFTRSQINSGNFEEVVRLFNYFPHLIHSPALLALFFVNAKERADSKVEEYWGIYKRNLFESAKTLNPSSWAKRQTADLIWMFENRLDDDFHDRDWLQKKVDTFLRSSRYDMTLSPRSILFTLDLAEKKLGISSSESLLLLDSTLKVRQILSLGNFSQERIFLVELAKSGKVHETAFRDFCICLFALSEFEILVDLYEKTSKRGLKLGPNDYSLVEKLISWSLSSQSILRKMELSDEVNKENDKNFEIRIVTIDPESSDTRKVLNQLSEFEVFCEAGVNGASLPNKFQYLLSDSPKKYKPGTLGCFLSHYLVWASPHKSEWITILEDDVTIQSEQLRNLILKSQSNKWDLVFINESMSSTIVGPEMHEIVEYELNEFIRPRAPGAYGYIVSKTVCKELVAASESKEWKGHVDHFILDSIPRLKEMGLKVGVALIPAVLHAHSRTSKRQRINSEN